MAGLKPLHYNSFEPSANPGSAPGEAGDVSCSLPPEVAEKQNMVATSGNLLQWIVVCLLGLAVIMVSSAGMSVGGYGGDGVVTLESILLGRPIIYATLAVLAMAVVGRVDLRHIYTRRGVMNPVAWLLIVAGVLCIAVLVPGVGRNVNGANRWLYIGPRSLGLSFQPSELAKWASVLAMAWWGARRAGVMKSFFHGLFPGLIVLGAICLLVLIEDLGTAVLIGMVGLFMLVAAGARIWQVLLLAPVAFGAVALAVLHSPYRYARIMAFKDPWADPEHIGYHPIQSLVAVAGGNVTGRGLGNGFQKFGYLPEDTTDFLFAVICEELGVVGAAMVIGLYVGLLWVGLGIVKDCKHAFGRLVGLGVLLTIGIQAAMNIAVVTVVVPTKGIALPLLSNGGTGWVMTGAAVGLLVALDRINQSEAEESEELPEPALSVSASRFLAV
jgi:cell division protein FtsW